MDYASLLQLRPKLKPILVSIVALEQPLLIHLFTSAEIRKITGPHPLLDECETEADKNEMSVRIHTLYFLGGMESVVNPDGKKTGIDWDADWLASVRKACDELLEVFTGWQVRDIYKKAMQANGHGPEALGEALKNSERTLH